MCPFSCVAQLCQRANMSLFSGLFNSGGGAASSGLFSAASAFKHEEDGIVYNRTAASQLEDDGAKGKKRKDKEQAAPLLNGSQAKKQKQNEPFKQASTKGSQHAAAHGARMPAQHASATAKAPALKGKAVPAAQKPAKQEKSGKQKQEQKATKKPVKKQIGSDEEDEDNANSSDADADDDNEQLGSGSLSEDDGSDQGPSDTGEEEEEADGGDAEPSGSGEGDEAEPLVHEAAGRAKPKETPEQQAEKLTRTLFVGNVPASSSRKELTHFFSKYGKVASVRLRAVPLDIDSKLPRRAAILTGKVDGARAPAVAYVVFDSQDAATAGLAANMAEFGGHHLRVNRATVPSKKKVAGAEGAGAAGGGSSSSEFDPTRSLFIGNLHFQTTDEELIAFFTSPEALAGNPELAPGEGGAPALEAVRVVRDAGTSVGKGFAFALFRTKAAARAGLSLDGRELRKRSLRITRVSVQQQAKVRMARAAAAAGDKGSSGHKKAGGSSGSSRGGPGGGKGGRGGLAPALPESAWQGVRTKGKGGGVRGGKAVARASGAGAAAPPPPSNRKRDGKRPAVAARKARKAGATQQQPSPSPGGVKSGGVSKPFRGRPMKGGMKGPGGGPGKGRGGKPAGGRGKRQ